MGNLMSERYGLKILREDGSVFHLDSQATVSKIIGAGQVPGRGSGLQRSPWNSGVKVPVGWDFYCWLSEPVGFYDSGNYPRYMASLNANREVIISTTKSDRLIPRMFFTVIGWLLPGNKQGRYGIEILNGSALFQLTGQTDFSTELYRGEVNVTWGWSQSHINSAFNRQNTICFFYTTNKNVCISGNVDAQESSGYYPIDAAGNATSVVAKVVIFGLRNGSATLKTDRYGLEIFNAGVRVYNSGWRMLTKPKLVSLAGMAKGAMTGVAGVKRPMYSPATCGGYDNRQLYQVSDGYSIGPGMGVSYRYGSRGPWGVVDTPLMVLDAEDYFAF